MPYVNTFRTVYQYDFQGCRSPPAKPLINFDENKLYDASYDPSCYTPTIEAKCQVKCDPNLVDWLICEYKDRNKSMYQVSYCEAKKDTDREALCDSRTAPEMLTEMELKHAVEKFYHSPKPVPRPLNTARDLFGFYSPDQWRTGLTEYHGVIGQLGFQTLKCGQPERDKRIIPPQHVMNAYTQ